MVLVVYGFPTKVDQESHFAQFFQSTSGSGRAMLVHTPLLLAHPDF